MVEVFKTNVERKAQSKILLRGLSKVFPAFQINFDLSDCDRVLRIEGREIEVSKIMVLVNEYGFDCELLDQ